MHPKKKEDWKKKIVKPEQAISKIVPGMSIYLSTGFAEPGTLIRHLMMSDSSNLQDLELIQLVSIGDIVAENELRSSKFRLKTFFSGWVASDAITQGRVDLIPSRFSNIPKLIESEMIHVDAAFIQVSPPNRAGYCSMGIAVDAAREAMDKATLKVAEINEKIPLTYGDTFIPMTDFDMVVISDEAPIWYDRFPKDETYDQVAANIASEIDDESCIAFSIGPIFEALADHLRHKHHLGIHSPFFTDSLMELVESGAVSNRYKEIFRGKSLASYAFGTPELMDWLNRNPLVEFQGIEKVFNPLQIGRNPKFVAVFPARKVDLSGRAALPYGKGNITAGQAETMSFFNGAELSEGGQKIFALPSRNRKGESNLLLSVEGFPNLFGLSEVIDMVITEYGTASLVGRTIRERAQALIDIAHPDDRPKLVEEAKEARILYKDQIFLAKSALFYPSEIDTKETFKNGVTVRFRAIKPSDEEGMRRLFYRFSDKAVYYRYFSPIKTMPHEKMQQYVNVDYKKVMSIVGLKGDPGKGRIIAEARYVQHKNHPYGDVAFVVDEEYQGIGMATFMYKMLIRLAREKGLQGFTADVLASNKSMMKVFEKGGEVVNAKLEHGVYQLTIRFNQ